MFFSDCQNWSSGRGKNYIGCIEQAHKLLGSMSFHLPSNYTYCRDRTRQQNFEFRSVSRYDETGGKAGIISVPVFHTSILN